MPSSRSRSRGGDDRLREGDEVEADYRGKGKYYPARVARVHRDGTVDVKYDDGDREAGVPPRRCRKRGGGGGAGALREGDEVEADYRGRGKFYAGKITRDRRDGTYDVRYDDGDAETRVAARLIRRKGQARARDEGQDARWRAGQRCEGRFRGGERWHAAEVRRVHSDGSLDLRYDDGDEEVRVRPHLVRVATRDRSRSRSRSRSKSKSRSPRGRDRSRTFG